MLQNYKSNPVAERKSGKKIHFCYNNMNINKIYSLGLRIWPGGYAELEILQCSIRAILMPHFAFYLHYRKNSSIKC